LQCRRHQSMSTRVSSKVVKHLHIQRRMDAVPPDTEPDERHSVGSGLGGIATLPHYRRAPERALEAV